MRVVLIALFLLFFTGCTTKRPAITEYKLVSDNKYIPGHDSICNNKTLKISQAFSSTSLMTLKMNYALSNNRVFSYSKTQWSESPNHMITDEIVQEISVNNIFKNVQISRSRGKSELTLESNIEEFMQYYSDDLEKSHVKVVISFTLIDTESGQVIESKSFEQIVDSKTMDASGGVEAFNTALDNILNNSIEWLREVCK